LSNTVHVDVGRVADPHDFNADPDPAFDFNADTDPYTAFLMRIRIRFLSLIIVMGICDN
jgi:hypothetical protein